MKIYTGIGSRETPPDVLKLMQAIGYTLGTKGWTLRSGHAPGADQHFELGAMQTQGKMEIYLPWKGFEGAPESMSHINADRIYNPTAVRIAEKFHPAWAHCSQGAKKLHICNVYQVLGATLEIPTNLIICWTKDGKGQGGTGQALRIAKYLAIPIFDLATCTEEELFDFINEEDNGKYMHYHAGSSW